jgi:aminoglycoside phosphotransferase (APT) family kinase protein
MAESPTSLPVEGSSPQRASGWSSQCYPGHAWLAAAIPLEARRFRVTDPALAHTLAHAGAELVDDDPDVEIAPLRRLRGDAAVAIVSLDAPTPDVDSRLRRATTRLAGSLRVRTEARAAKGAVQRLGYSEVSILSWDLAQAFSVRELPAYGGHGVAELLPRHAAVVARRSLGGTTALGAAIADASRQTSGGSIHFDAPSMREAVLVAVGDSGVLRVAVGPARNQLLRQAAALEELRATRATELDPACIAWPMASGRSGLADWALEDRLRGTRPEPALPARVLADCLDFLAALNSSGPRGCPSRTPLDDANLIAAVYDGERSRAVFRVAERLAREVAALPHGFAHGDFFRGNLLVDGGRLAGVVDWDAAGPGRLTLLDLLHLRHMGKHLPADRDWGLTIVQGLLPWARAGGDELTRGFCRRLGLEPTAALLEALAVAYWLERLAYQLSTYADRTERQVWLERNVDEVLRAVGTRAAA